MKWSLGKGSTVHCLTMDRCSRPQGLFAFLLQMRFSWNTLIYGEKYYREMKGMKSKRVLVVALVACLTVVLGLAVMIQFIRHKESDPNGKADNSSEIHDVVDEEKAREIEQKKKEEHGYLQEFVRITEDTYPEKSQRSLYWEEKECSDNALGIVKVPGISQNGSQDLSWFCEDICDWLEECIEEVPYEKAPWLYSEIIVMMPSIEESFDPSPYLKDGYNRDSLYEGLYDFVDGKLTSADYPVKDDAYGTLEFTDNGDDDFFPSIEPDCSYTTQDGITYGLVPVDRAAGSSYYSLYAYKKNKTTLVNPNPFLGRGGEAKWIEFIDDLNLGFACLTYNGGDDGLLFRSDNGGMSFVQINYPSAKVKLSDGTIYNPFTIPEKVWAEGGEIYLLAGQSPWTGDYYSEELDKHPQGLYVSHDDGMSFEYVGER